MLVLGQIDSDKTTARITPSNKVHQPVKIIKTIIPKNNNIIYSNVFI